MQYLLSLGDNADLDDKTLTHKLAMLLALTTAGRASEIQALDLEYMTDKGDVIQFTLPTLTKSRRQGQECIVVQLHEYNEVALLDVVQCVRDYIVQTRSWRTTQSQHKLLLATVKLHKPVVTCTVSNWLKKLMAAAGIDISRFKGHSTRSAATSKAASTGLSIQDILKTANWKNARTFHHHYNRSGKSQTSEFAQSVLKT